MTAERTACLRTVDVVARGPAARTRRHRRRTLLAAALGAPLLAARPVRAAGPADGPFVEVWKSPTCGCCADWIRHLEAAGFRVKVDDSGNTAARARFGVDPRYGSCHTARVAGYVVEGHVPAREIRRLLAERPKALGLAVPGMPVGSPGMDGPIYAGRRDPYDVLLLGGDGRATVYARYR